MLRWPKPCSHNPPRPSTAPWEDNRKVVTHHLWIFVHTRLKSSWTWKDPSIHLRSTLLSHSATTTLYCPWIPSSTIIHFFWRFPMHPFISLNCIPVLLLIWISVFFRDKRLCVCAPLACYIQFSCHNLTKTARAALWMQPQEMWWWF